MGVFRRISELAQRPDWNSGAGNGCGFESRVLRFNLPVKRAPKPVRRAWLRTWVAFKTESNMDTPLSESEAIRLIIREGSCGDYADVANAVRKRFGLIVGGGQVEQVYLAMQAEKEKEKEKEKEPESSRKPTSSSDSLTDVVIQFVQVMGGFDRAREAISKLEATVRKLS